ncbi:MULTISPECIES: nitroreductase family protein [Actinomycetes]|uniref:nitroreductase family protein n=1 Tax=Actinomycetes TaxID=1760 RepID=UPI0009DCCFA4|nr:MULTISPECIES: nitroreductase family protein [Actinomycetes]
MKVSSNLRRWLKVNMFPLMVLWDIVIRGAFWAEVSSVYMGIRRHQRDNELGRGEYFVRRHIHMLEKGLSMRPRRDTFAEGYIRDLVRRSGMAIVSGALDSETERWVRDVLDAYFDATAASPSTILASAREMYEQYRIPGSTEERLAPRPVGGVEAGGDLPTLAQLVSLTSARESVRWFEQTPVDREVVNAAVRVALESPSACNRLPYRFYVLDSPEGAQQVANLVGGTAGYLSNIQSLIAVVGDLSAYAHSRDRHLIYVDSGLSVMSLLLGFQAQGVSTCCINWPDLREPDRKISKLLGLTSSQRTVMLVAYGYADPEGLVPSSGKRLVASNMSYAGLGNQ